ncbi:hypothetical protein ACFY3U_11420 [Micromonospora sp. NPDC000089]|uniref:hypothetical protein n=1 Tax=unclassified Micromonospora TaxID=2617518 RepID=UPI0036B79076
MFQESNRSGPAGGAPSGGPEASDAELARAVRRIAVLRTGFYVVVLLVALGGQVTGAMERLRMPWYVALPAVGALELGGVVVLANADVRRRLGERAGLSRVLSAAIAAAAVAFNWLAHGNHLEGGFYAGMSLLGYLVWLMNTENQRRDRLRARRQLPPTTPAYEPVGHWLRHPWLTRRARSLAKAHPDLGLYGSLDAAREQIRAERRQAALRKVLHRKITRALDATTADIAVAVYDLDEIARRLAEQADYEGLTALIAADLAPARVLAGNVPAGRRGRWRRPGRPDPAALAEAVRLLPDVRQLPTVAAPDPASSSAPVAGDPAPVVRASVTDDSAVEPTPAPAAPAGTAPAVDVHPERAEPAAQPASSTATREAPASRTATREAPATPAAAREAREASSSAEQPQPPRASDWAALHAELAPLLPPAAPRRAARGAADRTTTGRPTPPSGAAAEPSAVRPAAPSTTDRPAAPSTPAVELSAGRPVASSTDVVEPAEAAPSAPTRTAAAPARRATGRARVVGSAVDPEGIGGATRELPLVPGRDLPDLVDAAASRTTAPGAIRDAADGPGEQRPAPRPRQRPRDEAVPR